MQCRSPIDCMHAKTHYSPWWICICVCCTCSATKHVIPHSVSQLRFSTLPWLLPRCGVTIIRPWPCLENLWPHKWPAHSWLSTCKITTVMMVIAITMLTVNLFVCYHTANRLINSTFPMAMVTMSAVTSAEFYVVYCVVKWIKYEVIKKKTFL